jgi:catechol 2,3-dioxygenase-like lactoylglutathione lyase family enzyme
MMLANERVRAVLPVVDLKRANTFYEEKLGLQLFDEPGPGEAVFACGQGTQLALYQRATGSKADHTVAEFVVDNVEAVVQSLREGGVVFEKYRRQMSKALPRWARSERPGLRIPRITSWRLSRLGE